MRATAHAIALPVCLRAAGRAASALPTLWDVVVDASSDVGHVNRTTFSTCAPPVAERPCLGEMARDSRTFVVAAGSRVARGEKPSPLSEGWPPFFSVFSFGVRTIDIS